MYGSIRNRVLRHCYKQKRTILAHLRKDTFKTSMIGMNTKSPTIQDATTYLADVLKNYKTGCLFAGTGQYFQQQVDHDRVLMLHFAENFLTDEKLSLFDTSLLIDCCLRYSDVDYFMKNIKTHSNLPVYYGEVDFLESSSWHYGFTLEPFSIFSGDERICFLENDYLFISTYGKPKVYNISDIKYVGLWVSDEPYNERKLLIGLNSGKSKNLVYTTKENLHCDLAALTVDTEWMMKAAALLCLKLAQKDHKVQLKISPVLQPGNNDWVAIRQKIWIDMIHRYSEKDNLE